MTQDIQGDTPELTFSRSGSSHPLGPFDAQLERIWLHSQTIDVLRGKAAQRGMNLSEFLRWHLETLAYGVEGVQRMHADHVKRIVANMGA